MIFSLVESSINWNRPVKFLIENILEIKHQKKKFSKLKLFIYNLYLLFQLARTKLNKEIKQLVKPRKYLTKPMKFTPVLHL
jgi:hypothetical protein